MVQHPGFKPGRVRSPPGGRTNRATLGLPYIHRLYTYTLDALLIEDSTRLTDEIIIWWVANKRTPLSRFLLFASVSDASLFAAGFIVLEIYRPSGIYIIVHVPTSVSTLSRSDTMVLTATY